MSQRNESRRKFLKNTATVLSGTLSAETLASAQQPAPASPGPKPVDIVDALGDVIIPTDGPAYPGYKNLSPHGISARVLGQLRPLDRVTPADLARFNESAKNFNTLTFLESDGPARIRYVKALFDWTDRARSPVDAATMKSLQRTLRLARNRILTVFYRNFPDDAVNRDATGAPIPNRPHEIFSFKDSKLTTGWDIAGYNGPLSWDEEQQRRGRFKKILWSEGQDFR